MELTERILDGLGSLRGVRVHRPHRHAGAPRRGLVQRRRRPSARCLPDCSTRTGVCLRGGHHCAQPLMDAFDLPATARASLAPYNDARRCRRPDRRPRPRDRAAALGRPDDRASSTTTRSSPRPRRATVMAGWPSPTSRVTCDNPLCGDRVTVDLAARRRPGRRARPDHPRLHSDPGGGLGARPATGRGDRRRPRRADGRDPAASWPARTPSPPGPSSPCSRRSRRSRAATNACCCPSRPPPRRWPRPAS